MKTFRCVSGMLAAVYLFSVSLFSQSHHITIRVIAPESTPKDAKIFIAGNDSVLGNWDPEKVVMTKENDSLWSISGDAPSGSFVEFKITLGSWQRQAMYEKGIVPGNTHFTVVDDTVITVRPIGWSSEAMMIHGSVVGTVNYYRGMTGEGLRYARDIIVWLPPSYTKETSKRYPVLYMHDGQNIIDPATSFLGYDWRVDNVSDSLIKSGKMKEIIIVGIYNSPDRTEEYSDTDLGHAYARFVVDKLKPFIDSTYRTLPDQKNTAVMGSSMGGLISFLFVWWYPNVFYQAGCLSSAFLSDNDKILKQVKKYSGPKKNIRVYLDNGSVGLDSRLKPGFDEMVALLKEKGYKAGNDLESFYDEGAEHNEMAWANRIWKPLEFMFGR
jgi:predicted alpha/beta superfamily hydrolase